MVHDNVPSPVAPQPSQNDEIELPALASVENAQSEELQDEDFPDYEELTPELLEDECIRGDAMLRWAVTLLAVLLGWVYVTETPLLVSIRAGEYMLSHGIVPPRTDLFSSTAAGRPWVNLSWLSDLLLGGLVSLGGLPVLSLLCAATVGISWRTLSRISLPGVTTWWGSVCYLVALIALFPVFQPGASTITILGLALLCSALHRSAMAGADETRWQYIPLLVLWANLDSSAWIGMLVLALFLAGECLTSTFKTPLGRRKILISASAVFFAGLLCPWPLRPFTQAFTDIQNAAEARQYLGLSELFRRLDFRYQDPVFWQSLDLFSLASIVLVMASAISLCLNWKRLHAGWVLPWLGLNAVGIFWGPAICYAAVLNAVIATLNGQDWYRHHSTMGYQITTGNVLWSRAGRAVMVLGIFLLAYLSVNGAFMGAQGRRIGLGLDPRWKERIQSLELDVVSGSLTDNVFPTVPSQGDLLIWIGKKPYIDSRLGLYRTGGENLLQLHRETRTALFAGKQVESPEKSAELWKANLDRFQTYDVLVRLWGPAPGYSSFFQIYNNPAWVLTGLGSAGANLSLASVESPELKGRLAEHQIVDFSKLAFRPKDPQVPVDLQGAWPVPVSRYDRWLMQRLDVISSGAQLGRHYLAILAESGQPMSAQSASGLAMLAIRECRDSLLESPNAPPAYRVQGEACRILQQLDLQLTGVKHATEDLETQILSCAFASAIAGNEDPNDLLKLFQILVSRRSFDTALTVFNRYSGALHRFPQMSLPQEKQADLDKLRADIENAVHANAANVDRLSQAGAPQVEVILESLKANCPEMALSLIEKDLTAVSRDPELQLLYANLLLQNGRIENALEQVEGLGARINGPQSAQVPPILKSQWRSIARSAYLASNNLQEFIKLTDEGDASLLSRAAMSLLQLPFGTSQMPMQLEIWPAYTTRATLSATSDAPEQWAHQQYATARTELEIGSLEAARRRLERLLALVPRYSKRTVAAEYLSALTGAPVAMTNPKVEVPAWVTNFDQNAKLKAAPAAEVQQDSEGRPTPKESPENDSSKSPEKPAEPATPAEPPAKSAEESPAKQ